MVREKLFRYFLIAVLLILIYETLHILSPFFTGIFGAIVITIMLFPLHRLILKSVHASRPNLAASISTVLAVVLIIIPFILLSVLLFNELDSFSPAVQKFGGLLNQWRMQTAPQPGWFQNLNAKLVSVLGISEMDFQNYLIGMANQTIQLIIEFGKKIPTQAFKLVVNILIMIFTLFFLFKDGNGIFKNFKELIPMDNRHKDQIANQLYITVNAVVQGVFLVAIAQGAAATLGFYIVHVPSPITLGFITGITSMIPFVGAVAVWLPIAIYYLIQGSMGKGIFILIWGIFVVSLLDNVLRIYFVGFRAKLPILLLFFGILGGAKMYGPKGFFVGPLVIALVLAFIRIYQEVYSKNPDENSLKKSSND